MTRHTIERESVWMYVISLTIDVYRVRGVLHTDTDQDIKPVYLGLAFYHLFAHSTASLYWCYIDFYLPILKRRHIKNFMGSPLLIFVIFPFDGFNFAIYEVFGFHCYVCRFEKIKGKDCFVICLFLYTYRDVYICWCSIVSGCHPLGWQARGYVYICKESFWISSFFIKI